MVSGIYGYYDNLKDKIVYIGKSSNLKRRYKQHLYASKKLQIDKIIRNNPKRYDFIILKKCDDKKLNYWEITLIALFNPKFNFTNGGDGATGYKHTEEERKRRAERIKGDKNPSKRIDVRKKISESQKGEKHHLWGKKRPKHSERMKSGGNPMYNKKHTKEARLKMSESSIKSRRINWKNHIKYNLWDARKVVYYNNEMYRYGRNPNPCKCFGLRYKGRKIPCGNFIDFLSPIIIYKIIDDELKK